MRPFTHLLESYIKTKYKVQTKVEKEYRANGFGPGLETEHFKFNFNIGNDTLTFYQYGQNQKCAEDQIDEQVHLHIPELSL